MRELVGTLLMLVVCLGLSADLYSQALQTTQSDPNRIVVVAPGKFETTFNLRKGFGATWFDLKHDADRKRDLAPVADENGLFWVKLAGEGVIEGSWHANPAQKMELLENTPTRMRVRLTGWHMRYGRTSEASAMKNLSFELTHTLYPTGIIYTDYVLVTEQPFKLKGFLAILKATGHWGPAGKGEGKGEVHPASECGNDAKPGSKGPASWVLQWSNGPTYFDDMLMVFYKGKFAGAYWNEGYLDMDYRTGFNISGQFPDNTLPAGKTHIAFMFRIADDMNGAAEAAPYANDYRTPDQLAATKGQVDKADPGDFDTDGYNESEGCYVLQAAADGATFTLHGKAVPRMAPVFKVKEWTGTTAKVTLAGKAPAQGKDFNASVADGTLILQLLSPVKDDVQVTVTK